VAMAAARAAASKQRSVYMISIVRRGGHPSLMGFGDSDGKKRLPDGRGSVNRAESTRLLPSRDRQGAVSPKRLSTIVHGTRAQVSFLCDTLNRASKLVPLSRTGQAWQFRRATLLKSRDTTFDGCVGVASHVCHQEQNDQPDRATGGVQP